MDKNHVIEILRKIEIEESIDLGKVIDKVSKIDEENLEVHLLK